MAPAPFKGTVDQDVPIEVTIALGCILSKCRIDRVVFKDERKRTSFAQLSLTKQQDLSFGFQDTISMSSKSWRWY
jgi:hypothetical protein